MIGGLGVEEHKEGGLGVVECIRERHGVEEWERGRLGVVECIVTGVGVVECTLGGDWG